MRDSLRMQLREPNRNLMQSPERPCGVVAFCDVCLTTRIAISELKNQVLDNFGRTSPWRNN